MLIQKPHDVRLARIEFEAIDRDFELLSCEAPRDLRAQEFWGNARLGPPAQPAALLRIAVARSIDRHGFGRKAFHSPQFKGLDSENYLQLAELVCSCRISLPAAQGAPRP